MEISEKIRKLLNFRAANQEESQNENSRLKNFGDFLNTLKDAVSFVDGYFQKFRDVLANCFCASVLRTKFTRHLMHRARALRSKVNNNRANGHCYNFAWI